MKLLAVLLLLVAMTVGANAVCCNYPLTFAITTTTVYPSNFKCSEPIRFTCSLTNLNDKIAGVGVLGNKTTDPIDPDYLLKSHRLSLVNDITCDIETGLWKFGSAERTRWSEFGCAYKFWNGTWFGF